MLAERNIKQKECSRRIESQIRDYFAFIGRSDVRNKPRVLVYFTDYMVSLDKEIRQVNFKEMEAFIEFLLDKGLSHAQIAQQFSILRKFFDYLVEQKRVSANIARSVFARANKVYPRHFTNRELNEVFRQFHPRS